MRMNTDYVDYILSKRNLKYYMEDARFLIITIGPHTEFMNLTK